METEAKGPSLSSSPGWASATSLPVPALQCKGSSWWPGRKARQIPATYERSWPLSCGELREHRGNAQVNEDLKEVREGARRLSEGTASAKALKQECAWDLGRGRGAGWLQGRE